MANQPAGFEACYGATTLLQYIGLTAGEAFIVLFVAGFIISWQHWPRVGAWLLTRFVSGRTRQASDK